jgi:putative (di)nucleoside polyphosphate hydrolase
MSAQDLPYRIGVGAMLMNPHQKVFVAKRIDMVSEAWQMPQGGIDAGETPEAAVMRELKEETGTDKATILAQSKGWLSYDLPEELVPKIWGGNYRGQKQKWFLMRFTGTDADINIHTPLPEFSEWKWVEMKRLPDVIVPFKRQLYLDIVREFNELLY